MKRIIVFCAVFLAVASSAVAADVTLTVVVPDAYVARAAAAVTAEFPDCAMDGLTTKQCAEKHMREWLKKIVLKRERITARAAADAALTEITVQ